MDDIKNFIENIPQLDIQNKIYIQNDFASEDGDTVRFYLEHHLESFEKEHLSHLVNFDDETPAVDQLLSKLKLVRFGIYPENEENYATFDYSIDNEITDYLVVIITNKHGELVYITMES